jgi:hypothetical protein
MRDSLLLLPRIATIRIYANFVSQSPAVIVVDPAGLGLPGAARDISLTPSSGLHTFEKTRQGRSGATGRFRRARSEARLRLIHN